MMIVIFKVKCIDDSEEESSQADKNLNQMSPSKKSLIKLTKNGTLSMKKKHSDKPYKPTSIVFEGKKNS